MKRRLKQSLAGLGLLLSFLLAAPAFANNYTGDCASYPGSFDGNGDVTITDSSCSIGDISAAGSITINASGTVVTGNLSTTYGQIVVISSAGSISTGTVTPGWYATLTADGTITPGTITATGGEVNITSASSTVTTENITARFRIHVTADGKVILGAVNSTENEVVIKSTTGDVETEDPITAVYDATIEAPEGKITVDTVSSTYYYVNLKAGKEVIASDLTGGQYGNIVVTTPDGDITTGKLDTGYSIKIKTDDGNLDIDTVRMNRTDANGTLYLVASENIKTKAIDGTGTSGYGSVEIRANTAGGTTPFIVGGSSNSNGVNGTISTANTTGGGNTNDFIRGGVYITNGTTSAGGITVTSMGDINVNASAARSGIIILDAKDGVLTLPSGTMQSNGAPGFGAGQVTLVADEIHFGNDTTISASQNSAAAASVHGVILAADTITFGGTSGLTIRADGNGVGEFKTSSARIVPKDAVVNTSTAGDTETSYTYMLWYTSFPVGGYSTNSPLNLSGSAGSPLTVTADGDHSSIAMSGYPINFAGGDLTVHSRGATNHTVNIGYSGTLSGTDGISFAGTGDVNIDVNGNDGDGGTLQIFGDHITVNAPAFNLSANGPDSGDGNSGTIYFNSSELSLDSATSTAVTANAAPNGSGDAVYGDPTVFEPAAITFYANADLTLGTGAGRVSFSANGGADGGNGGTIVVSAYPGTISLESSDAVTASAIGGTGNGGWIYIPNTITAASNDEGAIKAVGSGDGEGGQVFSYHNIDSFDFENIIKVDDGDTFCSGVLCFARSVNKFIVDRKPITLNGVTCTPVKNGDGSTWPKKYWSCLAPGDSKGANHEYPVQVATDTLSPGLGSVSNVDKIAIMVFKHNYDYVSFFARTSYPAAGETIKGQQLPGTTIYANLWEINPNTSNSFSENGLKSLATHELGHAFDIFFNRSTQSASSGYDQYVQNDFLKLDYAYVDPSSLSSNSPGSSVLRNPCAPTTIPGGVTSQTPPLQGFTEVCDGTTQVGYFNEKNSYILQTLGIHHVDTTPYFLARHYPEGETVYAWNELFAESFSFAAYSNTMTGSPPPFIYINPDTQMKNGYFGCVVGWASAVIGGTTSPSVSGCSTALPNWWTPIQ